MLLTQCNHARQDLAVVVYHNADHATLNFLSEQGQAFGTMLCLDLLPNGNATVARMFHDRLAYVRLPC